MMAGNPNWWSMHSEAQQPSCPPPLCPQHEEDESFSLPPPLNSGMANHHHEFFPHSLSQLLMSGLASGEEDKCSMISWIEQHMNPTMMFPVVDDGQNKQEILQSRSKAWLGHGSVVNDDEIQTSHGGGISNWYGGMTVSSTSPKSCITSTTTTSNTNTLDFSNNNKADERDQLHDLHQHHSPDQCDSIDTAGVSKKARVHSSSSAQPALKVRKEKVGDRVRALHQIVSPFGKTDTASVLTEATGYIRFLHAQIEALSSPYMRNSGSPNFRHQHQGNQEKAKDLRSRGLCLVPQSCIAHHAGNDFVNGADYWTPSL